MASSQCQLRPNKRWLQWSAWQNTLTCHPSLLLCMPTASQTPWSCPSSVRMTTCGWDLSRCFKLRQFLCVEKGLNGLLQLTLTVPRSWIWTNQSRKCDWLQQCKAELLLTCHMLSSCKICMLVSGASAIAVFVHFLLHRGTTTYCFIVMSPVIVHAAGQRMSLGSDTWPQEGHLQFCGVQLKYSREAPYALAGVSFELRPGQKVGICGRTGQLSTSALMSARNSKSEQGRCMHGAISLHCHSFNNADLFLKVPGGMPALLDELLTSFNSNLWMPYNRCLLMLCPTFCSHLTRPHHLDHTGSPT